MLNDEAFNVVENMYRQEFFVIPAILVNFIVLSSILANTSKNIKGGICSRTERCDKFNIFTV